MKEPKLRTVEEIEQLRRSVNSLLWVQTLDLGDGIVTPGLEVKSDEKEAYMHLDDIGFTDASVLDIGACDGKYSFYAEAWGAAFVLSIDNGDRANQAFEIAKSALDSRVQRMCADFLTISYTDCFSIVLFMGVLYHLQDPMAGLRACVSAMRPGGMIVVESAIESIDEDAIPVMRFTETYHPCDRTFDTSNWWYPNRPCLEAMMRAVGLVDIVFKGGIANRGCWWARKRSEG